jgi:hypothetical protein
MNHINLYWPVYLNLEKEVLALANEIHFCDEQLSVYSIKIADLLFRVSAEIESLIKDLYRAEKNSETESPGKALEEINKMWEFDKKCVIVSATNMYFTDAPNRSFAPFGYADKGDSDYYCAYNAVKHDRVKNISKANVRVLVRAMAALYLLNVYYKNTNFSTMSIGAAHNDFDSSLGSEIFSVKMTSQIHTNQVNRLNSFGTDNGIVDCMYFLSFPIATLKKIRQLETETWQKRNNALTSLREFIDFVSSGEQIEDATNIFSIIQQIGLWAYKRRILSIPSKEEQLKAIFNSAEYKEYSANNANNLEKVNKDDVTHQSVI